MLQRPKQKRTDDTKAKRKGQMIKRSKEKDQIIQRPKKRTDDIKAKRKGQVIQRPKDKVFVLFFVTSVLFFWLLYLLSFSFDLCIICPFLLVFVSSVLFY
jgi:Flp pilus assembly protein TadB